MAMKTTFASLLFVALALFAFATPSDAARNLLTSSPDCNEHCQVNHALLIAHVKANFLSCAAHGKPIDYSEYCGPNDGSVTGCELAPLSASAKAYAESLLVDVLVEIKALRAALGVNVKVLPKINIKLFIAKVLSAAINVDVINTFNCYAGDKEFFLGAFILLDLDVNIKVSLKYLLTLRVYIDVIVKLLPTCQNHLSLVQAQVLLFADIVLVAGLKIRAIVDLCIRYLDCGLCGVLGISLQVILGPVLSLVGSLLGGLLGGGINLNAVLGVFVKLIAILKVCIVL